jgi:hypothetical protein
MSWGRPTSPRVLDGVPNNLSKFPKLICGFFGGGRVPVQSEGDLDTKLDLVLGSLNERINYKIVLIELDCIKGEQMCL